MNNMWREKEDEKKEEERSIADANGALYRDSVMPGVFSQRTFPADELKVTDVPPTIDPAFFSSDSTKPDYSGPLTEKSPGVKFDDEKCAYHLLPPFALQGTAWVFKYGGAKYAAWNHSRGMPWSKQTRAAIGHILEIEMGNINDDETNVGHVYHAICSLMMLAENMIMHPELNDLFPPAYTEHKQALLLHAAETKKNALEAIRNILHKL